MSEQYDPQGNYDVLDPEQFKVGELRQGIYFEDDIQMGVLEGQVFHYDGKPAGTLKGLILTRNDPPGELVTYFRLVHKD